MRALRICGLLLLGGCADVANEPFVEVSEPGCQVDADCAETDVCWVNPVAMTSACVPGCATDDDCADGLLCREMFETRACVDASPVPVQPPEVDEVLDGLVAPSDVQCVQGVDGPVTVPFTLGPDTTSAMIVPFTTDGGPVRPLSWTLPDGRPVFQNGGAGFLGVTSSLVGGTAPLFLSQSPLLEPAFLEGTHEYTVDATSAEVCAYVLLEEAAPSEPRLDVNLYLVGLDDLDADSAPEDADLAVVLDTLDAVYGTVGIRIGDVRVFDVEPAVADAFSVIDERGDIGALMETSTAPGPTDDDLLSINVFVVAAIDLPGSGAIGVSQGIPGPAGLHGTSGSGVVLTAEFLRLGNGGNPQLGAELTGVVMAHEVGHWLGLFHTSELAGGVQDPLDDTEGCDDIAERLESGALDGCPDRTNLMFPVADPVARDVTVDQGTVLARHPVTR